MIMNYVKRTTAKKCIKEKKREKKMFILSKWDRRPQLVGSGAELLND